MTTQKLHLKPTAIICCQLLYFIMSTAWQMQTLSQISHQVLLIASGAGTNYFNYKFDGNITPMDHMLRVLTSPRYAAVHAWQILYH